MHFFYNHTPKLLLQIFFCPIYFYTCVLYRNINVYVYIRLFGFMKYYYTLICKSTKKNPSDTLKVSNEQTLVIF